MRQSRYPAQGPATQTGSVKLQMLRLGRKEKIKPQPKYSVSDRVGCTGITRLVRNRKSFKDRDSNAPFSALEWTEQLQTEQPQTHYSVSTAYVRSVDLRITEPQSKLQHKLRSNSLEGRRTVPSRLVRRPVL